MTRAVVFTAQAREDAVDAAQWYDARQSGLGDAFLAELDRLVQRVRDNPRQFPQVTPGLRRGAIRRFPYGLFFREVADVVQVVACFHASRDPRRWTARA